MISGEQFNANGPAHTAAAYQILEQRYGDGTVYLVDHAQRAVFKQLKSCGLVSAEGQITSTGRYFVARAHGARIP